MAFNIILCSFWVFSIGVRQAYTLQSAQQAPRTAITVLLSSLCCTLHPRDCSVTANLYFSVPSPFLVCSFFPFLVCNFPVVGLGFFSPSPCTSPWGLLLRCSPWSVLASVQWALGNSAVLNQGLSPVPECMLVSSAFPFSSYSSSSLHRLPRCTGTLLSVFLFSHAEKTLHYIFFLRLYLVLERGEGRERGRETSICGCLPHAPCWGPGLQPRHVP